MAPAPALLSRLAALLSEITGTPAGDLREDSSQDNTRGWDSCANLRFITSVEEEFGVILPTAAVLEVRSLGDMARLLHGGGAVAGGGG